MGMRLHGRQLLSIGGIVLVLAAQPGWTQLQSEGMRNEPIRPIPLSHGQDPAKVELGARLFHDPRLSSDNSISCANCHPLQQAGVDGLSRSPGVGGALGTINTPTVFNAGFNLTQFWDGRAHSLEEQVAGPIHNPLEMASTWEQVLPRLQQDAYYQKKFASIYGEPASARAIEDAIAAFERSLTTPDSAFDRWLRGDDQALSEKAQRGYMLFKSYGCIACHQGVNVGGNMYQVMGAMGDYFADRGGKVTPDDLGRYNVTGIEADRHMFKVPSLRLAVLTAPYFHDAEAQTLEEAVQLMARYQLGRSIPDAEVDDILVFLRSLVGEHPALNAP